ncbi:uncharacterized protein LOC143236556 [Tachypleus tridentatus]|uniref:uncharacterized protein LOC143236556 n=1 Tax=Tachypleus tridentatus TaxID=6853 RepID=UPI003FD3E813
MRELDSVNTLTEDKVLKKDEDIESQDYKPKPDSGNEKLNVNTLTEDKVLKKDEDIESQDYKPKPDSGNEKLDSLTEDKVLKKDEDIESQDYKPKPDSGNEKLDVNTLTEDKVLKKDEDIESQDYKPKPDSGNEKLDVNTLTEDKVLKKDEDIESQDYKPKPDSVNEKLNVNTLTEDKVLKKDEDIESQDYKPKPDSGNEKLDINTLTEDKVLEKDEDIESQDYKPKPHSGNEKLDVNTLTENKVLKKDEDIDSQDYKPKPDSGNEKLNVNTLTEDKVLKKDEDIESQDYKPKPDSGNEKLDVNTLTEDKVLKKDEDIESQDYKPKPDSGNEKLDVNTLTEDKVLKKDEDIESQDYKPKPASGNEKLNVNTLTEDKVLKKDEDIESQDYKPKPDSGNEKLDINTLTEDKVLEKDEDIESQDYKPKPHSGNEKLDVNTLTENKVLKKDEDIDSQDYKPKPDSGNEKLDVNTLTEDKVLKKDEDIESQDYKLITFENDFYNHFLENSIDMLQQERLKHSLHLVVNVERGTGEEGLAVYFPSDTQDINCNEDHDGGYSLGDDDEGSVTMEDLETGEKQVFLNSASKIEVLEDEDVLIIDTITNEAILVESTAPAKNSEFLKTPVIPEIEDRTVGRSDQLSDAVVEEPVLGIEGQSPSSSRDEISSVQSNSESTDLDFSGEVLSDTEPHSVSDVLSDTDPHSVSDVLSDSREVEPSYFPGDHVSNVLKHLGEKEFVSKTENRTALHAAFNNKGNQDSKVELLCTLDEHWEPAAESLQIGRSRENGEFSSSLCSNVEYINQFSTDINILLKENVSPENEKNKSTETSEDKTSNVPYVSWISQDDVKMHESLSSIRSDKQKNRSLLKQDNSIQPLLPYEDKENHVKIPNFLYSLSADQNDRRDLTFTSNISMVAEKEGSLLETSSCVNQRTEDISRQTYTPDFDSDTEDSADIGSSCSSTSGSFECLKGLGSSSNVHSVPEKPSQGATLWVSDSSYSEHNVFKKSVYSQRHNHPQEPERSDISWETGVLQEFKDRDASPKNFNYQDSKEGTGPENNFSFKIQKNTSVQTVNSVEEVSNSHLIQSMKTVLPHDDNNFEKHVCILSGISEESQIAEMGNEEIPEDVIDVQNPEEDDEDLSLQFQPLNVSLSDELNEATSLKTSEERTDVNCVQGEGNLQEIIKMGLESESCDKLGRYSLDGSGASSNNHHPNFQTISEEPFNLMFLDEKWETEDTSESKTKSSWNISCDRETHHNSLQELISRGGHRPSFETNLLQDIEPSHSLEGLPELTTDPVPTSHFRSFKVFTRTGNSEVSNNSYINGSEDVGKTKDTLEARNENTDCKCTEDNLLEVDENVESQSVKDEREKLKHSRPCEKDEEEELSPKDDFGHFIIRDSVSCIRDLVSCTHSVKEISHLTSSKTPVEEIEHELWKLEFDPDISDDDDDILYGGPSLQKNYKELEILCLLRKSSQKMEALIVNV